MFGLTRREQLWAAQREALELAIPLALGVVQAKIDLKKANTEELRAENAALKAQIAELQAKAIPDGFVPIQKSLVRFLRGEGHLDGQWITGEHPLHHADIYWWRKYLPRVGDV